MDGASKVIENDNVSICPVCDEFVDKLQPMEVHVNAHFNEESTSDFGMMTIVSCIADCKCSSVI